MERRPIKMVCLCQDGQIAESAVEYCIERARRTGEALLLVMLMEEGLCDEAEQTLSVTAARIAETGVTADHEVFLGDKESELLKVLARLEGPVTLVWGGDPDMVRDRHMQRAGHWLTRMLSLVDCPVVFPVRRGR